MQFPGVEYFSTFICVLVPKKKSNYNYLHKTSENLLAQMVQNWNRPLHFHFSFRESEVAMCDRMQMYNIMKQTSITKK
jgi:hypothetical protein